MELIARRERGGQPIEPDTRDWKKKRDKYVIPFAVKHNSFIGIFIPPKG